MRELTQRPSPSAPPSSDPLAAAGPEKAPSTNPVAPATASLELTRIADHGDDTVDLRHLLRPASNQRSTWNDSAGRVDNRPDAKTPFNTCLLYTSPSPRDRTR